MFPNFFTVLTALISLVRCQQKVWRNPWSKLLEGLLRMYKDNGVDKYYDSTLLSAYSMRYKFFLTVIIILAVITILAPLLVRLFS